jgi:hypothetical protein
VSTNILFTGDGRRIEFDVPDQALETAEELRDQGAPPDIAITNVTPILAAAELRRLLTALEQELQDAPAANFTEDNYEAGFIAGLDEAKKLVQARIAELGGAQ